MNDTLLAVLVWGTPITIIVLMVTGFVANREFLTEVARRGFNAHVFDRPPRAAETSSLHPLKAGRDNLVDAIAELARFAKNQKPDWVMGVHVGGRLLSVALCDVLGIPPERCLFVSTHLSRNRLFAIEGEGGGEPNSISGSMLIVDDISRSGTTLRDLKNFLHRQNYDGELQLSKVSFAVLVVADKEDAERKFYPDWAYYHTLEKYFRLPWTDTSIEVATAYDRRERNSELFARGMVHLQTDINEAKIEEHERQARNFAHALKVAGSYLRIDEIKKKFADLETAGAKAAKV